MGGDEAGGEGDNGEEELHFGSGWLGAGFEVVMDFVERKRYGGKKLYLRDFMDEEIGVLSS